MDTPLMELTFSPPSYLNDMDGALSLGGVRNPASFNEFDFSDIFGGPAAEGTPGASKQSLPVLSMHQCLKELSDLNVELHAQWLGVSPKPGDFTFAPYICPEASYVMTSEFTILKRALTAFQKFYGILSNVEWLLSRRAESHETRDGANSEAETSLFNGALDPFIDMPLTDHSRDDLLSQGICTSDLSKSPRLNTALVLVVISCYVQLVKIFADMCSHIEKHVKQLKKNEVIGPVDAIRFVQVGAFCVWDGRLQGLMFCTIMTHYLDRIERILGLLPDHRQQNVPVKHVILDGPYYRELLEKELGARYCRQYQSSKAKRNCRKSAAIVNS
ncbi:hypothetical protein SUNI508_09562 [Seiridium unicorne]|uniref:Uncharacterized protein n=1 Tax=Seiridium unicorne TaxID=138068 RepID=A0ABR2UQ31_9PEZI